MKKTFFSFRLPECTSREMKTEEDKETFNNEVFNIFSFTLRYSRQFSCAPSGELIKQNGGKILLGILENKRQTCRISSRWRGIWNPFSELTERLLTVNRDDVKVETENLSALQRKWDFYVEMSSGLSRPFRCWLVAFSSLSWLTRAACPGQVISDFVYLPFCPDEACTKFLMSMQVLSSTITSCQAEK